MTTLMRWVPWLASDEFDLNARVVCLEEIEELRQLGDVGGNEDPNAFRVPGR